MLGSDAAWQAALTLQWRGRRVTRQLAISPSIRSSPRCSRQPARALPLHAHREPARLLSVADWCHASPESHARLCGRLASCCDAAVKRDMPATAARQPSLIATIATLTTNSVLVRYRSTLAHSRLPSLLKRSGLDCSLPTSPQASPYGPQRPITHSVDLRWRCSGTDAACLCDSVDGPPLLGQCLPGLRSQRACSHDAERVAAWLLAPQPAQGEPSRP